MAHLDRQFLEIVEKIDPLFLPAINYRPSAAAKRKPPLTEEESSKDEQALDPAESQNLQNDWKDLSFPSAANSKKKS